MERKKVIKLARSYGIFRSIQIVRWLHKRQFTGVFVEWHLYSGLIVTKTALKDKSGGRRLMHQTGILMTWRIGIVIAQYVCLVSN